MQKAYIYCFIKNTDKNKDATRKNNLEIAKVNDGLIIIIYIIICTGCFKIQWSLFGKKMWAKKMIINYGFWESCDSTIFLFQTNKI